MVWGPIWKEGKSRLVNMTRDELAKKKGFTSRSYIQALREGLLPDYNGTRHFQQDNAAIHRSAATSFSGYGSLLAWECDFRHRLAASQPGSQPNWARMGYVKEATLSIIPLGLHIEEKTRQISPNSKSACNARGQRCRRPKSEACWKQCHNACAPAYKLRVGIRNIKETGCTFQLIYLLFL